MEVLCRRFEQGPPGKTLITDIWPSRREEMNPHDGRITEAVIHSILMVAPNAEWQVIERGKLMNGDPEIVDLFLRIK